MALKVRSRGLNGASGQHTLQALVVVLVTQPLSQDRVMMKHHEAPESKQFSKAWTGSRIWKRSRQKARSTESVAGQDKML